MTVHEVLSLHVGLKIVSWQQMADFNSLSVRGPEIVGWVDCLLLSAKLYRSRN